MENPRQIKKFKRLIRLLNFYPPYFFSGIKVVSYNEDFTFFKVRLKLTWYNKNLLGTAFGGSLYSMCDPFFMFILIINLGDDYIVWDKAASIDFKKPGKGTVFAEFRISPKELSEIKKEVDQVGKKTFTFPCEVIDNEGKIIANLSKDVYVRKKSQTSI
jgi:acyl-coenzyme A thioesterase PaaI-like protein